VSAIAIADSALLSDRHDAALVRWSGSIDPLCHRNIGSPSIFGRSDEEVE
jgi:hypothetical protein